MVARIISRVAFWSGVVAALSMPFVPTVYRWFNPPRKPPQRADSLWDFLGAILNGLGTVADSIAIAVWTLGVAVAVVVASLVALIAAWRAGESSPRKWLCGLPVLLAVALWCVMALAF